MKKENGMVLKNSDGLYYYGMNAFGKELRKAKIYKSLRYAQEAVATLGSDWERKRDGCFYKANVKRDFVLVNIEIREV